MFLLRTYSARFMTFNYFVLRLAEGKRGRIRESSGYYSTGLSSENRRSFSESEFIKQYRLSKRAFRYLCQELYSKTNLRASKRISLELKVFCAFPFFATGSY